MKIRLLPVIISLIVSSVVLFGGWFLYDSVAMENPLLKIVNEADGVEQANLDIDNSQVIVELKLRPDANLRNIYKRITTDGASIIGKRAVTLKVINQPSFELENWWSRALFDVAQAMETKQYAQIPKTLEVLAGISGLTVSSDMDDKHVYIRLTDGQNSKFVILPRTPQKLGVWPNE